MKTSLIVNKYANHKDRIVDGIASAENILICVAFLKMSGLILIKDSLKGAIRNGANVKIVVGLDFFITEPKALWELSQLCNKSKKAVLFICTQGNVTFHPKLYFWEKGDIATVIAGSANLTGGGLANNFEVSISHELQNSEPFVQEVKKFHKEIESHERVIPATRLSLSQYQRKYEIYTKKRKIAEKEAKDEASNIYVFDEKKLQTYLSEYRKSKNEKGDLKHKRQNYKKAKELLDQLVDGKITTKTEFLNIYEQLVGAKDNGSLWHSGGLFRSKNKVAKNFKPFLKFLVELRKNLNLSPDKVFDISLQHAKKIDGLGVNVITEIMNTYKPRKFAVLNRNPVGSLAHLGFEEFKSLSKNSVTGEKYLRFNLLISELAELCDFRELSEVDHFLNFVYWKYAKPNEQK